MISLIIPIAILAIVLWLMKRWFPWLYNLQKRIGLWTVKTTAKHLWRTHERKGGANVRPVHMRWRD